MAIYKQASTVFEASTPPLTTGLVGTIGVRIMDGQGATTTARTTAGIVETPAGTGIYVATLTTPAAAGDYVVVWDTGGITPVYGNEDLVVTTGPPPFSAPTGQDLCTLADVRERRNTRDEDVDQDAVVARVITGVSAAITSKYDREFTPSTATRTIEVRAGTNRVALTPYEIRTITLLRLNPDEDTPTTLDPADYRLAPNPAIHGTYPRIRLRAEVAPVSCDWDRVLVEITGDWGFAAIPDDVREAAILTVVHNLRTTVGQYSIADGAGGETRYERVEIPQAAKDLLEPFCRQDKYF